ncbi:MAG: tRNA dihydrouridine synthase DusB [Verrucomicrobiota bacterium]
MLPWFQNRFPLFLAPMAGVTDKIFRQLCKELGADVTVTEFVSAEGIFRRNARTMEYLDFDECERPLGVQLFGADPEHLGEAARMVIDWVHPDFLDLNFGCPVNKVVSRNGGSALLKDCPLLERVAAAVVKAAAPCPVTAKIRIGWDAQSVNAVSVAQILEATGVQALAVHGRTKDQGYGGKADWEVIGQVAHSVRIPVVGNGDIQSAVDVARHRAQSGIAGIMIGRAAMSAPWIFREIKHYLATGELLPSPMLEEQWALIRRHCALAIERRGAERPALHSMRARLMAYTRGMPGAKHLRARFAQIESLAELDEIAAATMP